MISELLDKRIWSKLSHMDAVQLCEVRLRVGQCIKVFYGNSVISLSDIICCQQDIDNVLLRVTNNSMYTISSQLKQGFITTSDGIRIGICGKVVWNDDTVSTIKDITSLVIRIPHEVNGCARGLFNFIYNGSIIKNTLIVSPAGCGKTTYLKDVVRQFDRVRSELNILVLDERGELNLTDCSNCDILSYCSKKYGFLLGIRTLRPDIIVCDELISENDVLSIKNATALGIKVIATAHGELAEDVLSHKRLGSMHDIFDRIIVLCKFPNVGCVEGVYDGRGKKIVM